MVGTYTKVIIVAIARVVAVVAVVSTDVYVDSVDFDIVAVEYICCF